MLQYNFHVQNKSKKVEFQIKALRSASCEGSNNVYKYSNFWSESINSTARNILGICTLLIRHSPISSQFFNWPDSLLIEPRRDPIFCHLWGISFTKPFIIIKNKIHISNKQRHFCDLKVFTIFRRKTPNYVVFGGFLAFLH